jgi:hypothetical protein
MKIRFLTIAAIEVDEAVLVPETIRRYRVLFYYQEA